MNDKKLTIDELLHWLRSWRLLCRQFSSRGDCQSCEKQEGGKAIYKCDEAAYRIRRILEERRDLTIIKSQSFPKIICLCGSTRFTEQMLVKQWELTKQGHIVLSWCALPDSYFQGENKTHVGDQEGVKEIVDEVHKRKIDLADEVFIINVGGYIGQSTTNEIRYAIEQRKLLRWLEPESTADIFRSLWLERMKKIIDGTEGDSQKK